MTVELALSWPRALPALPVDPPTRRALWAALVHKAEFPTGYVLAIIESVVRRDADGSYVRDATPASMGPAELPGRVEPLHSADAVRGLPSSPGTGPGRVTV